MIIDISRNIPYKYLRQQFFSTEIWTPLICFWAIIFPQLDYVPLWDSMAMLEGYLFMPREHYSFGTFWFMNSGHASLGYFWPFWIGQFLFPNQILMVHIINILMGSLAIIAFCRIVTGVFHGLISRLEITLITIALAVHPIFIVCTLCMNPDYGIFTYFLCTLWLLGSNKFKWAAVTGVLLVFSKELGLPIYLFLVTCFLVVNIKKYRWETLWPLVIPLLIFIFFCFYQLMHRHPIFPAASLLGIKTSWRSYIPNPFTIEVRRVGLCAFILNFQWAFSFIILAGLFWGIFAKRLLKFNTLNFYEISQRFKLPLLFFTVLLLGNFYIISRVFSWTIQRYLLILYPLVLLTFLAAINQLDLKKYFRIPILIGCIILLLFSNFRTLDPVSKRILKTFMFGTHPMIIIPPHLTYDPDDYHYGQDSEVYNLQHSYIPHLLDMAMSRIQPNNHTTIVMMANYDVLNRLNPKNHHRTTSLKSPHISPVVLSYEWGEINQETLNADHIFAVLLPNFDNTMMVDNLNTYYQLKKRHKFIKNGYELDVLEMTRKPKIIE